MCRSGTLAHAVAGLGLSMSFPVSSQSMAKSKRTSLALATNMDGATTRRCTPAQKRRAKTATAAEKYGCRAREAPKETSAVSGSPSQERAPTATQTEDTRRTTRHRRAPGWEEEMISVRRRSKAFRSSQATWKRGGSDYCAMDSMLVSLTCSMLEAISKWGSKEDQDEEDCVDFGYSSPKKLRRLNDPHCL